MKDSDFNWIAAKIDLVPIFDLYLTYCTIVYC